VSTSSPLTREAWARLTELFGQVLELQPADRAAFVAALREAEPRTAAELDSLLEVHERPGEFLPELPVPFAPPDLAGRTLGSYRLLRLIGTGGMGAVYLAERADGAFSKRVAVKLLSAAFLQARDRFHREREFLARLEHPSVTRLYDAGATADGMPYLVMEYVEGVPIDRYCAERQASLDERLLLLLHVCAGVAHAHQNLIVHCDIKPENILVTARGTVKLLDFGIARLLDPGHGATVHRPATPAYSSPEQLQGGTITTASDVYSIGVLAYVVITGQWPYRTRSGRLDEMLLAVVASPPVRASELAPHFARRLRGDLDNILAKAVDREPQRRYASVQQLADDLDAYRHGHPVRARADTFAYRLRKAIWRHRVASAAAALAVVSLAVAALVSTWQARAAQRRFDDLRALAHAVVFDVNDALSPIPGTTAARKLVVETALRYLDRLNQERVSDPALREELAAAYIRIGKVQGGAFLPNLGDSAGAASSFRKAIATTGPLGSTPNLERVRIEAHVNLALLATDPVRGIPEFDAAIHAAEGLLGANPDDLHSLRLVADAYHGRSTIGHLTTNVPDHERNARRQVDVRERIAVLAPDTWQDRANLARAIAQLALAHDQRADFDSAAALLQRARTILEAGLARHPGNQVLVRGLAENRSRTGAVLLSQGKMADAAAEIEAAVALLDPLVASDQHNVQYKSDLAYGWLRLGDVRRAQGDRIRALSLHRRALAVRRERAVRDPGSTFVPWELARSLNTVGELLLEAPAPALVEAEAFFTEAAQTSARALTAAPSFNQLRKQVAMAEEGLARVALAREGERSLRGHRLLEQSARTWREVASRSSGDRKDADRPARVDHRLAALPSAPE
jgi:eukaryotic-like serine/threonine-protein kinase